VSTCGLGSWYRRLQIHLHKTSRVPTFWSSLSFLWCFKGRYIWRRILYHRRKFRYCDNPAVFNLYQTYGFRSIITVSECFSPLKTELLLNFIYKNSVRTSQETHYVSATKTNQLMLFRKTVAVFLWEPYGTHRYTLWAECTVSFSLWKQIVHMYVYSRGGPQPAPAPRPSLIYCADSAYSDHWALKCWINVSVQETLFEKERVCSELYELKWLEPCSCYEHENMTSRSWVSSESRSVKSTCARRPLFSSRCGPRISLYSEPLWSWWPSSHVMSPIRPHDVG
jgi:hypothetical protein